MERSEGAVSRARQVAIATVFVCVGVVLMANPLYLPVAVTEPTVEYVHTVQPTDPSTPEYGGDPVAYEQLSPDAREVFDSARRNREVAITDPDARIDRFAYPTEPSPEDGFYLIERDGETYELWTRTLESDGTLVLLQRLLVQPTAFLAGFFAVVAGALIGSRSATGSAGTGRNGE